MNVVLVRFKGDQRRDFTIAEGTSVVGRRPDCALRIPTRDVSRQHCEIQVGDDAVHVRDLGSANGTFVNGTRVAEAALNAGDRLAVGPVIFVVQIDGEPQEIEPLDTDAELIGSIGEEEPDVMELGEDDFDLDDPMSALGALAREDEAADA